MTEIIPTPKKTSYFQREYIYNGETVRTSLDILLGEEEYILEITFEDGITIIGGSEKAVYYGECTLEQIIKQTNGRIPAMKIEDEPKFAYRGFMIDCSRHFFSIDELKAIIDTMSRLKFNKFHWHLSDDQGFRMEIKSLPKLHEEGSVRKGSNFGSVRSASKYSGYYTTEQMKEIVKFCAEHFVDIVPELDIPGHCSAIVHAYPEISCRGRKIDVKTTQGIFKDILCAGNEKTYQYIYKILDEMCDIFPSDTFHIGGDEVPKDNWTHCSECKNMMRENSLENYDELQAFMMNKVITYLEKKGKKVICWNDAVKGDRLKNTAIVERWLDRKNKTVDWANEGRKVLMSDFYHTYFDYPYEMTPLKKVYKFKPYLNGMDLRGRENVIGMECCLWTEHISSNSHLEYMLFPRACAVAENAWGYGRSDWRSFIKKVNIFKYVFRQNRIHFAPRRDWNPLPLRRLYGTLKFLYKIKPRVKEN